MNHTRKTFPASASIALLLALLLGLAGCRAPAPSTIPDRPTAVVSETLVPGDALHITFIGNRDFDQSQRIRSNGKISLPTIGEYRAGGKTLSTVQGELSGMYKKQLQNAEVVVTLEGTAAAVYVVGAVGKPGKVTFDRPMTAFDAIMESGGFAPGLANPKKVLLIRNVNGKQETKMLDLSPALKGKTTTAFYLKPYDTLQVQERFF
jgi:polysaccharide export outer membrane protein